VSVQDRCLVCDRHTIGSEIVLDTLDGTPRLQGSSESSVHLEIVLTLSQYRCTVCVERSKGSEIVLDTPDGTLGDVGLQEFVFFSFVDSVSVGA
jgi:hypothetical protein